MTPRRQQVRRTTAAAGALALLALLAPLLSAPSARASEYIYFTDSGDHIGRVNVNGSELDQTLVAVAGQPGVADKDLEKGEPGIPYYIAANSEDLYWADEQSTGEEQGTIARANLGGGEVNLRFIPGLSPLVSHVNSPIGVAVAGEYVYWTNSFEGTTIAKDSIGRAKLNGTDFEQNFIKGIAPVPGDSAGLAVYGGYIYWANGFDAEEGSIGRAKLNGEEVLPEFVTGAAFPGGVAVNSEHIYWYNAAEKDLSIGRAEIDGGHPEQKFITPTGPDAQASGPGLAINSEYIYWTNHVEGGIGRAKLDGEDVESTFIGGVEHGFLPTIEGPLGIALSAPVPPAPSAVISSPVSGVSYEQGAVVPTAFSCVEGVGGPGLESCVDSNGVSGGVGTLATSVVGVHSYSVTARSEDGQSTSAEISYTVTAAKAAKVAQVAQVAPAVSGESKKVVEEVLLGCSKRALVLNDVLVRGGRVELTGSAASSLDGKQVSIIFGASEKLASVTVASNGTFSANLPLPSAKVRDSNGARYTAVSGAQRSLSLKLTRRLSLESLTVSGGRVLLSGQVVLPLAHPVATVTVDQQLECGATSVVLRFKPPANGRFHVSVPVPAGAKAAIYRLTTSVRESARSGHSFATYSLPLPIALG
jgi:hypothetical protein